VKIVKNDKKMVKNDEAIDDGMDCPMATRAQAGWADSAEDSDVQWCMCLAARSRLDSDLRRAMA